MNSTSSVSADEISKFGDMSAHWWDYKQNPLITMNPARVSYMLQVLKDHQGIASTYPLKGKRILDVGCGGGVLSESLARLGGVVVGVDPSEVIASEADHHANRTLDLSTRQRLTYMGGISVEEMDSKATDPFDVICILEVLEHTRDPARIIEAASSLLRPPSGDHMGGVLFVSTINRTLKSYAIAILGAEYIKQAVPIGTHDWNMFYSPQEIGSIMRKAGLVEVDKCGMVISNPLETGICNAPMEWSFDKSDMDVNWIAAYMFKK